MNHKKVNLFVVGAMKAGTTSLIEILSNHSEIYVPPIKEPHFFVDPLPKSLYEPSRFFNLDKYFKEEFPKPIHISKIEDISQYKKLYSLSANEKYCVDASTAYLHAPGVAQKIYSYNEDAKIIILLRDPLKRAFSHYKMDIGLGRVNASFNQLMEKEIQEYNNGSLQWSSHIGMSLYKSAVENYTSLFKNVLVLRIEDLASRENEELSKISSFLGIKDFETSTILHKNVAREPKFKKLFYFLKQMGIKDYFSKYLSSNFRHWLFKKTTKDSTFKMEITPKNLEKLNAIFIKESKL